MGKKVWDKSMIDETPEEIERRNCRSEEIEDLLRRKSLLESLKDITLMYENMQSDMMYKYIKLEAKYDTLIDLMVRISKLRDNRISREEENESR